MRPELVRRKLNCEMPFLVSLSGEDNSVKSCLALWPEDRSTAGPVTVPLSTFTGCSAIPALSAVEKEVGRRWAGLSLS